MMNETGRGPRAGVRRPVERFAPAAMRGSSCACDPIDLLDHWRGDRFNVSDDAVALPYAAACRSSNRSASFAHSQNLTSRTAMPVPLWSKARSPYPPDGERSCVGTWRVFSPNSTAQHKLENGLGALLTAWQTCSSVSLRTRPNEIHSPARDSGQRQKIDVAEGVKLSSVGQHVPLST